MNFVIAKTMLDHISEFPEISIKEIANFSNTSIASVSKFCKELDYESFKMLRGDQSIFDQNSSFMQLIEESKNLPIDQVFESFQRNVDKYERDAILNIDKETLIDVSRFLKNSNQIVVYSGLHGYAATNLIHSILLPYEKQIYRINRQAEESVVSAVNKDADAIFVISLSGNWIIKQIELGLFDDLSLKKVILITHEENQIFHDKCKYVLSFHDVKDFFSSTYISDRLLKALVIQIGIYLSKSV